MTEVAENTVEVAEGDRKRAPASNFLPIVRGRLPLIFVHAIRFDEVLNAMSNKDLAAKFATSVGKVFDIKKGRNFGYVGADYKPTQDDVAAAQAWISAVGQENARGQKANGDVTVMEQTLAQYEARGLASAEEAAALSAARGAARKRSEKAEGNTVGTGESTQSTGGAADDLLS